MNVTEQGLREYIEVFHSTLSDTADQYIPSEVRNNLTHLSLLPARIIGYVSTQFGAAIEWQPGKQTQIEVVRGSARIEDLLVQAPSYLRAIGPAVGIGSENVQITRFTAEGSFPFRLLSMEASVVLDEAQFLAGSWNKEVAYAEVYGNRTAENWNREMAATRAKDEVLAALSELKLSESRDVSIGDYISKYKKNTVLLLGDYANEGMDRLAIIASVLKELGYQPLLVRDVPDIPTYSLPQKVVALGSLARFVVIDDSSKSGHIREVGICEDNKWVTLILRADGQGGSWMTAAGSHYSNVVLEKDYLRTAPKGAIVEAVDWAETKLRELQRKLDGTFPWRNIEKADG